MLALDKNDVHLAEEQHRLLVTHHMNVSTQWATALRQIIHSILADASGSLNNNEPVVLPDNEMNVVQFMDVSAKPVVLDAMASPFFQPSVNSLPAPIKSASFVTESTHSDVQTHDTQPIEDNSMKSKSKGGRFGPILHL